MDEPPRRREPSPAFATALDLIDGRGAALLLTGAVDEAAMGTVIRRMVGAADADRARVLALLNDGDPATYLPRGVTADGEDVRVFQRPQGRGVATSGRASAPPGEPTDPGEPAGSVDPQGAGPLADDLHRAIEGACEELARPASSLDGRARRGFEPGVLRVVVDSLGPLVAASGAEPVLDWLRTAALPTLRAPRLAGRSHWVYYAGADDPTVDALMADPSVFDVLVRVRRRGRTVEHQWVLPPDRFPHLATSVETPWMRATG